MENKMFTLDEKYMINTVFKTIENHLKKSENNSVTDFYTHNLVFTIDKTDLSIFKSIIDKSKI